MSHNPQGPSSVPFALPDLRVVALSGRDAVAFAQAQFMNDVTALVDGQWQWNGWLTPKGRVIALFALLRRDAETLWLLLPDADPDALTTGLQRFVFRAKVTIAGCKGVYATGVFAAPMEANGNSLAQYDDGSVELDFSGAGGPRSLLIGPTQATTDPAQAQHWAELDLAHGLPRLQGAQVEAWTPQQLSLERLRAFSVKKGCYPGQEIVARTHFLGQAKRGLALFDASAPVQAGSEVRAEDRAIGSIVSTAGNHALAVMPLDTGAASLSVGETALSSRALLDGLQR